MLKFNYCKIQSLIITTTTTTTTSYYRTELYLKTTVANATSKCNVTALVSSEVVRGVDTHQAHKTRPLKLHRTTSHSSTALWPSPNHSFTLIHIHSRRFHTSPTPGAGRDPTVTGFYFTYRYIGFFSFHRSELWTCFCIALLQSHARASRHGPSIGTLATIRLMRHNRTPVGSQTAVAIGGV